MRTISSLLAAGATAVALTAAAPATLAAPNTGSSSGSSNGSSSPGCGPRSNADLRFLHATREDDNSCSVQDSAIGLAHAQCQWLDAYGNSAHNQIILAEKARGTLKYPYLFLDAAIKAYCPQYKL